MQTVENPYRIWLTNFGTWANARCTSHDAAKLEAIRLGFQSMIVRRNCDGTDSLLGTYCPIAGYRPMRALQPA